MSSERALNILTRAYEAFIAPTVEEQQELDSCDFEETQLKNEQDNLTKRRTKMTARRATVLHQQYQRSIELRDQMLGFIQCHWPNSIPSVGAPSLTTEPRPLLERIYHDVVGFTEAEQKVLSELDEDEETCHQLEMVIVAKREKLHERRELVKHQQTLRSEAWRDAIWMFVAEHWPVPDFVPQDFSVSPPVYPGSPPPHQ